jgi:hypothetical protein
VREQLPVGKAGPELDQRAVEPSQAEPAEEVPAGDAEDVVVDDELEEQPA